MEGGSNALDAISTAVTNMATSVQTAALDTFGDVLPIVGVIAAAGIVATIGFKLLKKFGKI